MSDIFSVSFRNWGEIRQGSPYNTYSATFTGRWKPNLRQYNLPVEPDHGWTNLYATSDDGRYHALIEWDLTDNNPGFHIVIFDTQERSIRVSERYLDFPHTLRWENDAFKIDHDVRIVPGRASAFRKNISGCKAGCGVMLYVPTGLLFILGGLSLLVIAASGVQHVGSVGSITLDDVGKLVLVLAAGLISILVGVNYWRNAYLFWKRT
jgi:hypothetical protein